MSFQRDPGTAVITTLVAEMTPPLSKSTLCVYSEGRGITLKVKRAHNSLTLNKDSLDAAHPFIADMPAADSASFVRSLQGAGEDFLGGTQSAVGSEEATTCQIIRKLTVICSGRQRNLSKYFPFLWCNTETKAKDLTEKLHAAEPRSPPCCTSF